ncbi:hypothetical protein ACSEVQ_25180 [Pseudomonas aeruginosa]
MSKELNKAPVEQAGGDERDSQAEGAQGERRITISEESCGTKVILSSGTFTVEEVNSAVQEQRAALAQPSPAQAEQAEAERPIVSFEKYMQVMYDRDENAKRLDAAMARIAELEKPDPDYTQHPQIVGYASKKELEPLLDPCQPDGGHIYIGLDHPSLWAEEPPYEFLTPLYTAPVAQAQQLNDLDKQCRDDVARALGLRPNQERGFAWSYLLASIKSCVKSSEDAAQAQHSVPEGWMLVECGIWTQEQVDEMQKTVARFRNSEFVDDRALAMAVADAGQCKAPEISLAELLAAAPGKDGV